MQHEDHIAGRALYAIAANGNGFEVSLGIGRPYQISPDEWACPVQLAGLHNTLHDMHGADSWQALQLACRLLAQLLGYFIEDGGRLFWEKGGKQIAVTELFAKVPAF